MKFKIKDIREAAGMSQETLSEKSGISRTIISGLENGTITNTTATTLSNLAKSLGVRISDIFFECDV